MRVDWMRSALAYLEEHEARQQACVLSPPTEIV